MMRKVFFMTSLVITLIACSDSGLGDHSKGHGQDTANAISNNNSKKSLPAEANVRVGNTNVRINYHSPAVRGRVIWGGLVSYDSVWVTGAHNATTLEVGKDFQVGDKTIPAGKYALFTIPGKEEWIIIINKNWNQHLADDYSVNEDVARVKAKPVISADLTERLTYQVDPINNNSANITISWEKLLVPFQLTIVD